jgi:hypothetical protein
LKQELSRGVTVNQSERRASRRFPLQQHATLSYRNNGPREISAMTENASIAGVLLVADSAVAEGSHVEVTILLQGDDITHAIRLHGAGSVVRLQARPAGKFSIAVGYDHPLAEA